MTEPIYLKVPEAAHLFAVSYSHLDRAINAGEVPVFRPDAHRRVKSVDVQAWLDRLAERRAS